MRALVPIESGSDGGTDIFHELVSDLATKSIGNGPLVGINLTKRRTPHAARWETKVSSAATYPPMIGLCKAINGAACPEVLKCVRHACAERAAAWRPR